MEKLTTAARLFPVLAFTAFGLGYLLHFRPEPPASDAGTAHLTALWNTGCLFTLINLLLWAHRDYFKGIFEVRARAVDFTRRPLAVEVAVAKQL